MLFYWLGYISLYYYWRGQNSFSVAEALAPFISNLQMQILSSTRSRYIPLLQHYSLLTLSTNYSFVTETPLRCHIILQTTVQGETFLFVCPHEYIVFISNR